MSSTRHSRNNNMVKGDFGLNDDEIQEQLLNDDLKGLGINEDDLSNMETQEKKNLLMALKQSASPQHQENTSHQNRKAYNDPVSCSVTSPNSRGELEKNEIDITSDSPEEDPSLPSQSTNLKKGNLQPRQPLRPQQQRQPQLPKKPPDEPAESIIVNSNQGESDDDVEEPEVEEDDDDDDEEEEEEEEDVEEDDDDDDQPFNFPNFVDDDCCNLKQLARKKPMLRYVQYYMLENQCAKSATRTMLKHYNSWYKDWCSLEKQNVSPDDNNAAFVTNLLKNNSSKQDVEPSASKSSETSISYSMKVSGNMHNNGRSTSLEKSPSPDIEEIEVTEVKTPEVSRLMPSSKAKTLPRETRAQNNIQSLPSTSSSPSIDVTFDEKWDPDSGAWQTQHRGKRTYNRSTYNRAFPKKENRFQPKELLVVEEKVQCPICQLDFSQSKIENHAAICEGFPCETRNSPATNSSKLEETNNKDGFTNTTVVELTNQETKIANKKRVADNEDNESNKRMCVNRVQS